jgi:hypothetical protein
MRREPVAVNMGRRRTDGPTDRRTSLGPAFSTHYGPRTFMDERMNPRQDLLIPNFWHIGYIPRDLPEGTRHQFGGSREDGGLGGD